METGLIVVTAAGTKDEAASLARSAVAARLAASAQVHGPVGSYFWHLSEFGEGEEWVVVLRTTTERYDELEQHLLAQHPWDNPELIGFKIDAGSSAYLAWLSRSVSHV